MENRSVVKVLTFKFSQSFNYIVNKFVNFRAQSCKLLSTLMYTGGTYKNKYIFVNDIQIHRIYR